MLKSPSVRLQILRVLQEIRFGTRTQNLAYGSGFALAYLSSTDRLTLTMSHSKGNNDGHFTCFASAFRRRRILIGLLACWRRGCRCVRNFRSRKDGWTIASQNRRKTSPLDYKVTNGAITSIRKLSRTEQLLGGCLALHRHFRLAVSAPATVVALKTLASTKTANKF